MIKRKTVVALSVAALAASGVALPAAASSDIGVQLAGGHAAKACSPCAAKKGCNPCAAKKGCNPCAAKGCNPCAAKKGCNPCAAKKGCNPCAAKK